MIRTQTLLVIILAILFADAYSQKNDGLSAVKLDCRAVGVSIYFTNGGKDMIPGSLEQLICGDDVIELETNRIVDLEIFTKEYGKIKFEVPSFNTANIVFLLSDAQKELLAKYVSQ